MATVPSTLPKGYGRLTVSTANGASRGATFARVIAERRAKPLIEPRGRTACAQIGSQVWIFGGTALWGQTGLVEKYDLATQGSQINSAWMMVDPVSHAGAAVIGTGSSARIYVVGGWHSVPPDLYDSPTATLQIFNPNDGTWTLGRPLPKLLGGPAVAAYGGKLYVFGGRDRRGADVNTTYVYNPATNSWAGKANMPTARSLAGCVLYGTNRIWVLGGGKADASHKEVEEYDPLSNTWASMAPLSKPRYAGAAISSGTKVFFGHGAWGNDFLVDVDRNVSGGWLSDITVKEPSVGPAVGKYGNKIFFLGGRSFSGLGSTNYLDVTDSVWYFLIP